MSNPEWGIKRVCPSCSIKYYDFNKYPIICPECQFEFDPDLLLKSRKGRSVISKTEEVPVSNDIKKEDETLEDNINTIENDENILEIDDETDLQDDVIDSEIEKNINDDDGDLEIIDDDLNSKEDFSIEVDDETNDNNKNENEN